MWHTDYGVYREWFKAFLVKWRWKNEIKGDQDLPKHKELTKKELNTKLGARNISNASAIDDAQQKCRDNDIE